MSFAEIMGVVAAVVAVTAFIPYVISALAGKTKPNRATWLIWSVLGVILLASYHSSGATTTIWISVVYTIAPFFIFALSIKYGVGGYAPLDIASLVGAAIALVLWKITHHPETALYLALLVDICGFLPTAKKAYLDPASEDRTAWVIGGVAGFLNLLAVTSFKFQIFLYPLYLFVFDSAIAILTFGVVQKRFGHKKS